VDLGFRYEAFDDGHGTALDLSLALNDAQTILKTPDQEVQLPTIFGIGGALRLAGQTLISLVYDNHFSPVVEFQSFQFFRIGLEHAFSPVELLRLAARLGFQQRLDQNGQVTAGFGVEYGNWRANYGLQFSAIGQGWFHQMAVSWTPRTHEASADDSAAQQAGVTPELTAVPTAEPSARLFSALDTAASIEERGVKAVETAVPTSEPILKQSALPQETPREAESYAYRPVVPASPADQEAVSLAPELDIPGTFSGYLYNLKSNKQNFRIEGQALRLQIVVNPFSPNRDGRKDRTLFVGRVESENLKAARWVLNILRNDRIVRTFKGGSRLPHNLEWDGTDERGKILPDGTYDVLLRVFNENGLEAAGITQKVTIQIQPEIVKLTVPEIISLGGEKDDKPVTVVIPKAPHSSEWQARIIGPGNRRFYERKGDGEVPEKLTWIPRSGGKVAPDGQYRVMLSYYNDAGLKVNSEAGFRIGYAAFTVRLNASPELFQPVSSGGQGVTFRPVIQGEVKLSRWTLSIYEDKRKQPVRVLAGTGQPPETLVWDGKDVAGADVKGGKIFRARLTAVSSVATEESAEVAQLQSDLGVYTGKKALTINLVRVQFGSESAELIEAGRKALLEAAEVIKRYNTDYQIRVLGHCDLLEAKGREAEISRTRAETVAGFLVKSGQIPADKVQAVGYGTDKPLSTATEAADQSKNRRAEVVLFAK